MSSSTQTGWSDYYAPPIAAMAAIVPPFYGFVVKSAQQVGEKAPRMSMREAVTGGIRAAPTIGFTVGLQMVTQGAVERMMQGEGGEPSFFNMFSSAAFVGLVSAPPLAAFNGQTMGRTIVESVKGLTMKQTGAIVTRETSFLFALRISDPLATRMKQQLGDNRAVDVASAFASGVIGSMVGHPADTALTLWQKGIPIKNITQLMRGGPVKSFSVGIFTFCYQVTKNMLT